MITLSPQEMEALAALQAEMIGTAQALAEHMALEAELVRDFAEAQRKRNTLFDSVIVAHGLDPEVHEIDFGVQGIVLKGDAGFFDAPPSVLEQPPADDKYNRERGEAVRVDLGAVRAVPMEEQE